MPLALALLFSRDNFWKGANFDTNLEGLWFRLRHPDWVRSQFS